MKAFIVLFILTVLFGAGGIGSIINGFRIGQKAEAYDCYAWILMGGIAVLIAMILGIITIIVK